MGPICLLNDWHPAAGIGRYAYSLWRELRRLGAPVEMARYTYGEPTPPLDGQRLFPARVRLPVLNRTVNNFFFRPRPRDYNLYHAVNPFLPGFNSWRERRVLTVHDLIPLDPRWSTPLHRRIFRRTLGGIERLDRVIAVSACVKRRLVDALGVREDVVDVTPEGVDLALFSPGSKSEARRTLGWEPEARIVLHLAGDEPRKNLRGALLAFAKLKDSRARFVHLGQTSRQTRRLIGDLRLGDRVQLREGSVSDEELVLHYRAADAFFYPSFEEGFGLPVLEAMACGTPVLCADAGSLPEVAGDAALLAHPDDHDALARELVRILEDDRTARRLIAAGLRRAPEFSWQVCAAKTLESYRKAGWT